MEMSLLKTEVCNSHLFEVASLFALYNNCPTRHSHDVLWSVQPTLTVPVAYQRKGVYGLKKTFGHVAVVENAKNQIITIY